ncbi:MAG: NADH-quinone oxidoreductase subunit H, partial [Anaerolineae bacterium]|nr:NADH-quinone oxidoreductase subunit H [Anaerolineae bacterium]
LVIGLTMIAAFYLGGIHNPLDYVIKTLFPLLIIAGLQTLMTRLRIDQTVGMWWRYGALLALVQWLLIFLMGGGQ